MKRKSIIISLKGLYLSSEEKNLIRKEKPWGIILFKRNIKNLKQLKNLTNKIRSLINDKYYPILVDEEGGRVSRLSNIINTKTYSQAYFGYLYEKNKILGKNSYIEYLYFICQLLKEGGININTIPVLDIFKKNSNSIIGNRSFSKKINTVNSLKNICFDVLKKNKIGSVSKHIPGHGSSKVDTHKQVSIIKKPLKDLLINDFNTFKNINCHFAMTAHIIYKNIDPIFNATHSKKIINDFIRKRLSFKGILISDDISMKALSDDLIYNSKKALESGCNLVLYCKGNLRESTLLLRNINFIDSFTKKKTSEFYRFLR